MALDATIGGVSANSYFDVAAANAYFAERPFSTGWSALTAPGAKEAALIAACRLLEVQVAWNLDRIGTLRASSTQRLLFPRHGTYKLAGDVFYSSAEMPDFLLPAQCEAALALATKDRLADPSARGISKLQAGPLTLEFDTAQAALAFPLPEAVWSLLGPWIIRRANAGPTGIAIGELWPV